MELPGSIWLYRVFSPVLGYSCVLLQAAFYMDAVDPNSYAYPTSSVATEPPSHCLRIVTIIYDSPNCTLNVLVL